MGHLKTILVLKKVGIWGKIWQKFYDVRSSHSKNKTKVVGNAFMAFLAGILISFSDVSKLSRKLFLNVQGSQCAKFWKKWTFRSKLPKNFILLVQCTSNTLLFRVDTAHYLSLRLNTEPSQGVLLHVLWGSIFFQNWTI